MEDEGTEVILVLVLFAVMVFAYMQYQQVQKAKADAYAAQLKLAQEQAAVNNTNQPLNIVGQVLKDVAPFVPILLAL
jgi:predicted negative regulator of RcsB-dependent stress response